MLVARDTKSGTLYTTAEGINMVVVLRVLPIQVYDRIDLDI